MTRARCGSMKRGLCGQKMNPIAPAPAATAASASSSCVMPQIFTNIQTGQGHKGGQRARTWERSSLHLCVLSHICVLCGGRGSEQRLELLARLRGRHEALADEKRRVAERLQTTEIVGRPEPALADSDDSGRHPADERLRGVDIDLQRSEVAIVDA